MENKTDVNTMLISDTMIVPEVVQRIPRSWTKSYLSIQIAQYTWCYQRNDGILYLKNLN